MRHRPPALLAVTAFTLAAVAACGAPLGSNVSNGPGPLVVCGVNVSQLFPKIALVLPGSQERLAGELVVVDLGDCKQGFNVSISPTGAATPIGLVYAADGRTAAVIVRAKRHMSVVVRGTRPSGASQTASFEIAFAD